MNDEQLVAAIAVFMGGVDAICKQIHDAAMMDREFVTVYDLATPEDCIDAARKALARARTPEAACLPD
jgi:dihydroxyacid dehydratase/phosphogluconate dehydratase